jgi:hypothetical protein
MARSLLRQLEQIRRSETYDDAIAGVNTSAVAEPVISGSLEADLNVLRTLVKDLKGSTNWYDDLGSYFDPTDTDAGNTENKTLSITNLKNQTLDAKTVIVPVRDFGPGDAGYAVTSGTTGVLRTITTQYATDEDRTGLPVFASVSGTYDVGGSDNVVRVDVLNAANDQEFADSSGYTIYAKMHDGADNAGSGRGTDVYFKFYANGSECDLTSVTDDVSAVKFVYPVRKQMSAMNEYDWLRTDFVSSWEGDVELVEDITNLWSYTGATDGDGSPQPWSNASANYLLNSDPSDLTSAVDLINDGVGDMSFTEDNYLTDGMSVATALDTLDQELKDLADNIDSGVGEKYVESVASNISKNTLHQLPAAILAAGGYTPVSTAGREGQNMDVYVDGQLLAADTGVNGANADRDYGETTASGITFRFRIRSGRNITYIVRQ